MSDPSSLGHLIVQLCHAHRNLGASLLATVGLHPGQEIILMQLWREDGQTQTQLAAKLGVQPPTVTKMLQRLQAAGIVERRPSSQDGRVMHVFLTLKGRTLEASVRQLWLELERRTTEHLNAGEGRQLEVTLGKIIAGLRDSSLGDDDPC